MTEISDILWGGKWWPKYESDHPRRWPWLPLGIADRGSAEMSTQFSRSIAAPDTASLLEACGVSRVTVVTGYGASDIERELGGSADYLYYPEFAATNNLLTLDHAARLLHGDVVIMFSDVLVEPSSLQRFLGAPQESSLMIDTSTCRPETMRVQISAGQLVDIGNHISPEEGQGNFIGIARFSAGATQELRKQIACLAFDPAYRQAYYVAALPALVTNGHALGFVDVAGSPWIEIDSPDDYVRAQNMFHRLGEVTVCAASSES